MAKKHLLRALLGISMLAGVAGSTLLHQQKKRVKNQHRPLETFGGIWQKNDNLSASPAFLTITSAGIFKLNDRPLQGKIIQLKEQQLIFEDTYGYQLVLEKVDERQLSLYDDAEDQEYLLERIAPLEDTDE